MVNETPIIRAPTLSINDQAQSTSATGSTNTFNLAQLRDIIQEIVTNQNEILTSRNNDTVNSKIEVDQNIDPRYLNNLNDLDKIPDIVKSLRDFSGQPGEFGSWKKSVDRILRIYEHLKGTPKYYGILSVIRNKITGNADIALESYNTPLSWERISRCLTLHYADKRDLGTLEYQMTTLVQRGNSVPEFYQQVYYHLSLILNKLASMDMSQEAMNVMTQAYRDKALDTFVRGLKGDLPRLLSMRGPTDLPEALSLCLKLENVQYRVQHSHGNINIQRMQSPPLPPRRTLPPQHVPTQARNFYPSLLHNPQTYTGFPRPVQNNYQYPSTSRQNIPRPYNYNPPGIPNRNPFYKGEPMEVDTSIKSQQVNYQNRPRMNPLPNKRPYSNQIHQPQKVQRIHHVEPEGNNPSLELYQEQMDEHDTQFDQTLLEYTQSQENPVQNDEVNNTDYEEEPVMTEQLDDIHFLD